MDRSVTDLTEKEVQKLISDFPWLLSMDYETIPELANMGMEYGLTDNKRADLLLRDRKTGRLVIVEFKKVDFYRENIGQILEYRTRIINEYINNNDTKLKDIFGNMMLSPILILVVPNCSAEARLTCNLSGIEIYEYAKTVPEIIVPEKRKTLEGFIEEIKKDAIPFDEDRCEYVDNVYTEIKEVLLEEDLLDDGWLDYKVPKSEYFQNINHAFINKALFVKNQIGIGIYEDLFNDYSKIIIEYYSEDENNLLDFKQKSIDSKITYNGTSYEQDNENQWDVYTWSFYFNNTEFIKNVKDSIRPFIHSYKKIIYG